MTHNPLPESQPRFCPQCGQRVASVIRKPLPPPPLEPSRPCPACTAARERSEPRPSVPFDERECGGAFDGFCVTSDADPGL